MNSWSESAWLAACPVYDEILRHPFIIQLAEGTLPVAKFEYYLRQDALYLDNYAKVLAHIASRLNDKNDIEAFINFAKDGIEVEKAMHALFLHGLIPDRADISPTCLLYSSVLSSCATLPVEIEAAAVLPCFWVYQRVGKHIAALSVADNPYQQWIDTYSNPVFDASTQKAISICDTLAANAGNKTVENMTQIFIQCTKMEWLFWDSAWNLEQWKI